jgi:phosphate-selective porin OprO/OprP
LDPRAAALGLLLVAWTTCPTRAVAQRSASAPPVPDDRARFSFDVGWDAGPTYLVSRHVPQLARYDRGWLSEVELRGRIGGSLYLDGGWLALGQDDEDGFQAELRRARLYTQGELVRASWPTEYRVQFAFEDGSLFLNDFYLRWRPPRWVDTVRIGFFDSPISLEALTGSADRPMMEVPPAVAAFAPGYRLGIEATGTAERPSLTWMLNLASVGQSQPFAEASSDTLRAIGRGVWRPLDEAGPGGDLLHLGLSASFVLAGGGSLQYRSRAESILSPYLADTHEIEGNSAFVGLEAAWRRGPLTIQGEMLRSFVDAEEEGSLQLHGAYAQATWVLTGEERPYQRGQAIWGRIEPARPLAPRRGRWGALELTARTSWLDLDDGVIEGGRLWSASVGPAWTWNRWVRLLGSYVFARPTRSDEDDAHVLQLRIELQL